MQEVWSSAAPINQYKIIIYPKNPSENSYTQVAKNFEQM